MVTVFGVQILPCELSTSLTPAIYPEQGSLKCLWSTVATLQRSNSSSPVSKAVKFWAKTEVTHNRPVARTSAISRIIGPQMPPCSCCNWVTSRQKLLIAHTFASNQNQPVWYAVVTL